MSDEKKTFTGIMAGYQDGPRAVLETLRRLIHEAAPGVEECVSYGLPAFRLGGRVLIAIGATSKHCAIYPMSDTIVPRFAAELESFSVSKGTIRFPAERPPAPALVREIVAARVAEIGA